MGVSQVGATQKWKGGQLGQPRIVPSTIPCRQVTRSTSIVSCPPTVRRLSRLAQAMQTASPTCGLGRPCRWKRESWLVCTCSHAFEPRVERAGPVDTAVRFLGRCEHERPMKVSRNRVAVGACCGKKQACTFTAVANVPARIGAHRPARQPRPGCCRGRSWPGPWLPPSAWHGGAWCSDGHDGRRRRGG